MNVHVFHFTKMAPGHAHVLFSMLAEPVEVYYVFLYLSKRTTMKNY